MGRRVWATTALAMLLTGSACGSGNFGDFARQGTTTSAPGQVSVTLGGPASSDGVQSTDTTTTTIPTSTSSTASPTTVRSTGQPASTPPSQPVITGARTGATAANLKAAPACDSGRPVVRLSWEPAGDGDQVVAVSSRPDGLDSGNYTTSQPLLPNRSTHELRELQPGATSYWRVLTRRPIGIAASETSQFEVPSCTTG